MNWFALLSFIGIALTEVHAGNLTCVLDDLHKQAVITEMANLTLAHELARNGTNVSRKLLTKNLYQQKYLEISAGLSPAEITQLDLRIAREVAWLQNRSAAKNKEETSARAAEEDALPWLISRSHSTQGHAIFKSALSVDESLIFTVENDQTIRIWDAANLAPRGNIPLGREAYVDALVPSPDGKTVYTADRRQHQIREWNIETGAEIKPSFDMKHSLHVKNLLLSPSGKTLYSVCEGNVSRWNAKTHEFLGTLIFGKVNGWNVELTQSPNGKILYIGYDDGTLKIVDSETGKSLTGLHPYQGHYGMISTLRLSADGSILYSGDSDGVIRRWNALTGKSIGLPIKTEEHVNALAPSPDGTKLFFSNRDSKGVRMWNLKTHSSIGEPISVSEKNNLVDLRFLKDRKTLMVHETKGTVLFMNSSKVSP